MNLGAPDNRKGPVLLLVRIFAGAFLIKAGWDQLRVLEHSKDFLDFFRIAVPADHRWDPFFPVLEIVCGASIFLGFLTRTAVVLMASIMTALLLNPSLKEITGLNMPVLQKTAALILLAGLFFAGAGSISADRFLFKSDSIN